MVTECGRTIKATYALFDDTPLATTAIMSHPSRAGFSHKLLAQPATASNDGLWLGANLPWRVRRPVGELERGAT